MGKRGFGTVYSRNGIFWIQYYVAGRQFNESSRSRMKADADRLLKKRLAESQQSLRNQKSDRVSIGELLDGLLLDYRLNNPKSVEFAEVNVRAHLRPYFGTVRAAQLTTDRLNAYRQYRLKKGVAKSTVNREMALLRRAFNLGRDCTPPRVINAPKFPMFREDNVRSGFLEPPEYERLRNELPEELQPLFVVAYHTACRQSELLSLKWSQVDLLHEQITLNPGTTKNDEGRTVPIYGDMLPFLKMARSKRDEYFPECRYVFSRAGKPIKDLRESWDKACERAGLDGLLFHDLRRSAVRNMLRAGVPEKVAMAISGHKTRAIFDRYNIVSGKDLADAGTKLTKFISQSTTKTTTIGTAKPNAKPS